MRSLNMKTIKLGNNEQISRGIFFDEQAEMFVVMGWSWSKTYKTLQGAIRCAKKHGII